MGEASRRGPFQEKRKAAIKRNKSCPLNIWMGKMPVVTQLAVLRVGSHCYYRLHVSRSGT